MQTRMLVGLLAGAVFAAACGMDIAVTPTTRIVAIEPEGGATGVDPAAPIVITFSHPMWQAMEVYAVLHEGDVTSPGVPGTWAWSADRTQLTFVPAAPLESGTRYTLHLGGGMRDAGGGMIDYEYCLAHGGQWVSRQMMGNQQMMPGWRHQNGSYGVLFTFTTA